MRVTIRVKINNAEVQQYQALGNTLVLPSSAFSVLEDATPSNGFEEVTQTALLCGGCKTPWCKGECI